MLNLKCLGYDRDNGQASHLGAKLPYFLFIVFLLSMGCIETTYETSKNEVMQKTPQMSRDVARVTLQNGLQNLQGKVTNVGFSFIYAGKPIDLKYSQIKDLGGNKGVNCSAVWFNGVVLNFVSGKEAEEGGQRFAEALIAMMHYSSLPPLEPTAFMAFKEKARAWRALPVKPALPAEANRYRVLAEDAFKNKDFDKAIDYYDKALEAYPLWPQGQFNAALICGETGDYAGAVGHMKRYLELAPEAKDAKAAQEKIYVWEEKIDK